MKIAVVLLLFLVQLQVDILQAGPVSVVSEDNTEISEVDKLELSGSGLNEEHRDEEYINSSKSSSHWIAMPETLHVAT